jgi:hypothetical protein
MTMEAFLWSLLLAAISAITYLAYRHPRSFRISVGYPLLGFAIFGILMISVRNLAGSGVDIDTLIEEISKLENNKVLLESAAYRLKEARDLQLRALMIGGAIIAYLLILISLPILLSLENTDAHSQGRETRPGRGDGHE